MLELLQRRDELKIEFLDVQHMAEKGFAQKGLKSVLILQAQVPLKASWGACEK